MPLLEIRPEAHWENLDIQWRAKPVPDSAKKPAISKYQTSWLLVKQILDHGERAILTIISPPGYSDEADKTRRGLKRMANSSKEVGEIGYSIKTLIKRDPEPSKIDVLFIEKV